MKRELHCRRGLYLFLSR